MSAQHVPARLVSQIVKAPSEIFKAYDIRGLYGE